MLTAKQFMIMKDGERECERRLIEHIEKTGESLLIDPGDICTITDPALRVLWCMGYATAQEYYGMMAIQVHERDNAIPVPE